MAKTLRKTTASRPEAKDPKTQTALDGASSVFADDLLPGENLLWQSRAGAGAYARAYLRAVFMGVTFFMFATIWHTMVLRSETTAPLDLATWLFAALGAAYMLLPVAAFVKAKWFMFYALTNQRLIILQVFPKHCAQGFPIKALNRVVVTGGHAGNGSLLIDAPGATSKNPATPRAGFYGVKYAAKVAQAVETLQDPEAALQRAQAQTAQKLKQAQPAPAATSDSAVPPARFVPSRTSSGPTSTGHSTGHTVH